MYYWQSPEDYEEEDPLTVRRCPGCGSFLSLNPKGMKKKFQSADIDYTYDSEGEITSVTVSNEVYEDEPYWECKRCKEVFWLDDF